MMCWVRERPLVTLDKYSAISPRTSGVPWARRRMAAWFAVAGFIVFVMVPPPPG